jgi:hypothetical protein
MRRKGERFDLDYDASNSSQCAAVVTIVRSFEEVEHR